MPLQIAETGRAFRLDMRTRMPFRYGIATVTALPHLFVRVVVTIDGVPHVGLAADHLAPKWFTKDPNSAVEEDIAGLLRVVHKALEIAASVPTAETPFALWRAIYDAQAAWGAEQGLAPLLTGFGVSLVERAVIDAFCQARNKPFAALLHENALGVRLGAIHPELGGQSPADLLPGAPLARVQARHTVGLADPLEEAEIAPGERLDDGLPQSLAACIASYGLRHFKLKISNRGAEDVTRVRRIVHTLAAHVPDGDWAFSLDGNESYNTLEEFRAFWDAALADDELGAVLTDPRRLLFVEQPLHRRIALSPEVGGAFAAWPDRPPIIIDESDGDLSSLPTALSLGYAGTSHKNCKGVFKGIANGCLLEHRRRTQPTVPAMLSGEDLSNVGPVSLLQDLAVQAALGIASVERNGQHYFAGLSMFPPDIQQAALAAHPDIYRLSPHGFPTLTISDGMIALGSVNAAPFGVGFDLDVTRFEAA